MAFPRKQRLKGKEVRFLLRKRQVFVQGYFVFYFFPQYPNIQHHQVSFQIPLLFSKKAVLRNQLKRSLLQQINPQWMEQKIAGRYYKVFITLNKKKITAILPQFNQLPFSQLLSHLNGDFQHTFSSFTHFL